MRRRAAYDASYTLTSAVATPRHPSGDSLPPGRAQLFSPARAAQLFSPAWPGSAHHSKSSCSHPKLSLADCIGTVYMSAGPLRKGHTVVHTVLTHVQTRWRNMGM